MMKIGNEKCTTQTIRPKNIIKTYKNVKLRNHDTTSVQLRV